MGFCFCARLSASASASASAQPLGELGHQEGAGLPADVLRTLVWPD